MLNNEIKSQLANIGKLIITFRKVKFPNDSQEQFAARIGVGETTMSRIETGKGNVSIISYLMVLNTLELTHRIDILTNIDVLDTFIEVPKW